MAHDEHQNESANGTSLRQEYIYFYLVTLRGFHGSLEVYCTENQQNGPINEDKIENILNRIANGSLHKLGIHIEDVPWTEPGYLVFACKADEGLQDVTFHFDRENGPNHSFGRINTLAVGDFTILWCRNKRLNQHRRPLEECESERFHVNFHPEHVRLHEETGTNTGP